MTSTMPASGAQVQPLTQAIASQIASGQIAAPTTDEGWRQLASQYVQTPAQDPLHPMVGLGAENWAPTQPMQPSATPGLVAPSGNAPSAVLASAGQTQPGDANAFISAIKQHESSGNYTAYNAGGGASGAYQFIQSTWDSEAKAAGFGQYAGQPASAAPPEVQDAVARTMAENYYKAYGNWKDAAEAWYYPAYAGKPQDQGLVPAPGAGNTETVGQYGQAVVDSMGSAAKGTQAAQGGTMLALSAARAQLGVPYKWGGEAPGQSFDCSGLVQYAYEKQGVNLPRTAQAQYDATMKVPKGAQLQPGDLMFFGSSTSAITHVGIYLGNGQMIDAPHSGAAVRVEGSNWADYVGATRPTDPGGATTLPAPVQQNYSAQQSNYVARLNAAISEVAGR